MGGTRQIREHATLQLQTAEHKVTAALAKARLDVAKVVQARLDDLRAQEAELALAAPDEATHAPTPALVAEVADLLESVVDEGNQQKAKAFYDC